MICMERTESPERSTGTTCCADNLMLPVSKIKNRNLLMVNFKYNGSVLFSASQWGFYVALPIVIFRSKINFAYNMGH